MRTILFLTISNIFITFAWYGHLKFRLPHVVMTHSADSGE